MKIITWNINGIRARQTQVLDLLASEAPDVLCLQEIKADGYRVPVALFEMEGYWSYWHGTGGYSGVAMLVKQECCPERPVCAHPDFDFENRLATLDLDGVTFASIYVPNGGKDYAAKLRFLEALGAYAARAAEEGRPLVLCGDLNVARRDIDAHPRERKPEGLCQRSDERALLERILAQDLIDAGRHVDPDNDQLFTWWAPWENLRERNMGLRIDYVLVSTSLQAGITSCRVRRDFGTSDHGPVIAQVDISQQLHPRPAASDADLIAAPGRI